ncbi:hypothetical protein BP5796_01141 [Coleophoma crateriformis]|uniref:tripeptidyl-peptidase II n=1 Tax=Coleophoma crateriformis TaxID=565419 RepID=A0A3D8SZJ8_9HELO|nr:hypothetical protein BP5796_01141 [Coleophoma crateriformis]
MLVAPSAQYLDSIAYTWYGRTSHSIATMGFFQSFSAVLFLSSVALSQQQYKKLQIHETALAVPNDWTYIQRAEPSLVIRLSVALVQPYLGDLRKRLDTISNPSHQDFGSHLSKDQLRQYQLPHNDAVDSVVIWLENHDIVDFREEGAWVHFNASVASINSLLHCELGKYENDAFQTVYRASEYSLPSDLVEHVNFIYPITQFVGSPKRRPAVRLREDDNHGIEARQTTTLPQSCWNNVIPDCVADIYNINYTPDTSSPSSIGIAGFLDEYPSLDAVHTFLQKYSPSRNASGYSPLYDFRVEAINGGLPINNGSGVEAILDTEYSMSFTQPLNVTYYSTGGRGPDLGSNGTEVGPALSSDEPWKEFLEYMLAKDDETLPQVLSISYTDTEQDIPQPYASMVCDLFMQLTSRGVSILIASGDGGAAGTGYQDCYANDGTHSHAKFLPTFPVGCPYVTSVGATGNYLPAAPSSLSSGGFSDYFPRPAWQDNAALAYINSLNGSHNGFYNASGRGIPDISAVGSRFLIGAGGFEWLQSGTSASTPVWAAIIALINDKRMRAGKPSLGFLNPILYSSNLSAAFDDVVTGSGGSCTWGSNVELGWAATPGWDPATGLGTPNFPKLLEILG